MALNFNTLNIQPLAPEVGTVAAFLTTAYPWSPHDFIRDAAFMQADRAAWIAHLTRPLPADNDLRVVVTLPDGQRCAVFAEILPWDSQFFGYTVARLNGIFPLEAPVYRPAADFKPILAAYMDWLTPRQVRYLFAPADPRDLAFIRALNGVGFCLIETRCIYHRSLIGYDYPERYACRLARPDDVPLLAETAVKMVNPFDRFHADPFIRAEDADRMMRRWVEASLLKNFADVTLVPDVPQPTAFCTVRYHRDQWASWGLKLAQPVFSAVAPEFKGWYRKIISEINYHLLEQGAEHCFLITQITNGAVIAAYDRLGFALGKGEHVFRILL